ncbi:mannosyltransferase [uncultured Psychroserpens sp.]|uniref:mannosyltransferase n=1 Tax=uncultured Psychroserpens sp. TaxID=255436 RepID=UPI002631CB34|nr:mannosyltransferase [uncultured Psychroserpens sp.]
MQFWKLNKVPLLLTFVSLFLYWCFAYDLIRTDYIKLVSLYSLLWLVFVILLKFTKNNIRFLTVIAFLSRAIFILAIPNLSQDFYRFIWDGRMILEGFNPYLYTPESFIQSGDLPVKQAEALYAGMGELNGSHFTNYPPVNQLCFIIANLFSKHSILGTVIGLRLIIILADLGIFFYGKRLLKQLNIPVKNIFWYLLNPFIIIELTGNLHFEGVMIFFLIWSLYLLHLGKWKWAAIVFALSVSVKLIPLLFLPLVFWFFIKKSETTRKGIMCLIGFYSIIGISTLILFAPFFSLDFVNNYSKTVGLWFQNFEFNASIYYLFREIGYWFRGYNEIKIIGKILPLIVFLFVVAIALCKKNFNIRVLISNMLLVFTIYLFLSTTIHPWYLATLVILCVYTNYRYPIVWSFMIILSYLAYLNINKADKSENLWIISIEYIMVYAFFVWEVFIKKEKPTKIS